MDRVTLEALQTLDRKIEEVRSRIAEFDPLLAEVEEPALALESEVNTTRNRLQEMKVEERRLELAADEKRTRLKMLQERLKTVRNIREEAAVQTEQDIIQRALEADEQEALTLLDHIRKLEDRLEEAEEGLQEAQEAVEPRRLQLLADRESAREEYARLQEERESCAGRVDRSELRVYEAIKAGGRSTAVAGLTPDGACGHCFNIIPLQTQVEIRNGASMVRCEACGVILTPPGQEADDAAAASVGGGAVGADGAEGASAGQPGGGGPTSEDPDELDDDAILEAMLKEEEREGEEDSQA